jgi:hypothetical protein
MVTIDLHGIGTHDLTPELPRQTNGKTGFSRPGGAADNNHDSFWKSETGDQSPISAM